MSMFQFPLQGQKNDPPANIPAGQLLQQNGGVFATPGLDNAVFSAMLRPMQGLADAMPVMPAGISIQPGSDYGGVDAPLFDTITGVTAGNSEAWAAQPNAPCDDAPIGGLMKACALTQPYGRQYQGIQFRFEELGRIRNRGVETDLTLVNQAPITGQSFLPTGTQNANNSIFSNPLVNRYFTAGVSFQRLTSRLLWTGTPANNMAGGGALPGGFHDP